MNRGQIKSVHSSAATANSSSVIQLVVIVTIADV
jgi:hypothetical protein